MKGWSRPGSDRRIERLFKPPPDPADPRIVRFYDHVAPEYERRFAAEAEATWRAGILSVLSHELEGARVLDLGAGSGVGGRLLRAAGCPWIVGLDCSGPMLVQARGSYHAVVQADMAALPFADNSFDLGVAGFDTVNHLDPDRLRQFLSRDNLGRIVSEFVFDCFTLESVDELRRLPQSRRVGLVGDEIASHLSRHQLFDGSILDLPHHLLPNDTLLSLIMDTGWQPVVVGALSVQPPIAGHLLLRVRRR